MSTDHRSPRCPSCLAVLPEKMGDPMRAGISGNSHEAPLLASLWEFSLDLLDAMPEAVSVIEFCEVVAEQLEASPNTVRTLLDTARQDGLIEYEYRLAGKPRRRRAFIHPRRRGESVA